MRIPGEVGNRLPVRLERRGVDRMVRMAVEVLPGTAVPRCSRTARADSSRRVVAADDAGSARPETRFDPWGRGRGSLRGPRACPFRAVRDRFAWNEQDSGPHQPYGRRIFSLCGWNLLDAMSEFPEIPKDSFHPT